MTILTRRQKRLLEENCDEILVVKKVRENEHFDVNVDVDMNYEKQSIPSILNAERVESIINKAVEKFFIKFKECNFEQDIDSEDSDTNTNRNSIDSFIVQDEDDDCEDDEYYSHQETNKKSKKGKYNYSQDEQDYREFDVLKESIYDGTFFERKAIEDTPLNFKQELTQEQIKEYNTILKNMKEHYRNSAPSIIDILKMNVSTTQKQKLLEKVHNLMNSEILTPEYNSNLKFLNANIMSGSNDPELLALEERILKSAVNNGLADSYKYRILKSKMSFDNKVIAYKKLEIMETYEENDTSEYAKYKNWMDSLLSVPFGLYTDSGINKQNSSPEDISNYIKNIRNVLDLKLSFLEKPKDQIISIVSQMVRNPDANINAIGLYGFKGTGKSSIAESIAEALDRPFKMISFGGESDSSSLTGHNFTYIGSTPGRLINVLRETSSMNPIILLDEIDKISETPQGKELIGTLIHLTDSTTNGKYNLDKYFSGIEFDLSKILFIFTYNDPTKVDKILADRLFKIKVENYTQKEKLEITKKHLINTVLDKFCFDKSDITFSEEAILYLVSRANSDEGMRNIKTNLNIIIARINTLLLTGNSVVNLKYSKLANYYTTLPVIIPQEHIEILLDESATSEDKITVPFGMYT